MVMADANTMICCIIGDDQNKIAEFQQIRLEQNIIYTLEVIAEVVYVLTKVYQVSREEASNSIQIFLSAKNIVCSSGAITVKALQLFANNHLDFVDNVLLAYHQIQGIEIYSYDRKLMNAIRRGDKGKTSI